jgi:hypothetical protein
MLEFENRSHCFHKPSNTKTYSFATIHRVVKGDTSKIRNQIEGNPVLVYQKTVESGRDITYIQEKLAANLKTKIFDSNYFALGTGNREKKMCQKGVGSLHHGLLPADAIARAQPHTLSVQRT